MVIGGLVYLNRGQREANLPIMPVGVQSRSAITGPGLVLRVQNTSTRHLAFVVTVKNPTTSQQREFRLDTDPSGSAEVGFKEGWTIASGDVLTVRHNDYQTWQGSIPLAPRQAINRGCPKRANTVYISPAPRQTIQSVTRRCIFHHARNCCVLRN